MRSSAGWFRQRVVRFFATNPTPKGVATLLNAADPEPETYGWNTHKAEVLSADRVIFPGKGEAGKVEALAVCPPSLRESGP